MRQCANKNETLVVKTEDPGEPSERRFLHDLPFATQWAFGVFVTGETLVAHCGCPISRLLLSHSLCGKETQLMPLLVLQTQRGVTRIRVESGRESVQRSGNESWA